MANYGTTIYNTCHCQESVGARYQGVTGRFNFSIEPYPSGTFEWYGYDIITVDVDDYNVTIGGSTYNGAPIPNYWNNFVHISGSGDSLYNWDEITNLNKAWEICPSYPTTDWTYYNSVFDGLVGRLPLDIGGQEAHGVDTYKNSYGGTLNAYPENCFETPYFSSLQKFGIFGIKYLGEVDLFPPLVTGNQTNSSVDYVDYNFESGLFFYGTEDINYRTSGKTFYTTNHREDYNTFLSGESDPLCSFDLITGINGLSGYSCGSPIILQQPLNARTKIGGKASLRCHAVDYHGIDYSKYLEGHTEIDNIISQYSLQMQPLSYQWYRICDDNRDSKYPEGVKIPLIEVNGFSNGANTECLTIMDIDIRAPVRNIELLNYGSGYISPPSVFLNGGELSAASISSLIDVNGVVTGIVINNSGLYDWDFQECPLDTTIPSLSFSQSPLGDSYTATGYVWPSVGINQNPLQSQDDFIRGVRYGIDDQFSYYCVISGKYTATRTRAANLTIDNFLNVPLCVSNPNYLPLTGIEINFTGQSHVYKLSTFQNFTKYTGYVIDCAARPNTYYEVTLPDEPYFGSGYVFAEYGYIGKNGDCYRGENSSLKPKHTRATADYYSYVLDSGRVDYGAYIVMTGQLSQRDGDLLYGLKALPSVSGYALTHSGVAIDTILYFNSGFTRKYESRKCPGYLPTGGPIGEWHAAICSQRNYFGYAYASDNYGYNSQLNLLGCVGGFTTGQYTYCAGFDPLNECHVGEATLEVMWNLYNGDMVAGPFAGFRNDSLKRRHLLYLETHEPHVYGTFDQCSNDYYQNGALYLKDAGIQYNFLNYPSDSRLTWESKSGPFAYQWAHNQHSRDKNDNGISNNFLNIFDFTGAFSMVDHISLYGLYSGNSNTFLVKPCPLYDFGYKTSSLSSWVDAAGEPGQRDLGNYLTPIIEADTGPYKTLSKHLLEGKPPLPSGNITNSYDMISFKVVYQSEIYSGGGFYSSYIWTGCLAGIGNGAEDSYVFEGTPSCGPFCTLPNMIFSGDVSGVCDFSLNQYFPETTWSLKGIWGCSGQYDSVAHTNAPSYPSLAVFTGYDHSCYSLPDVNGIIWQYRTIVDVSNVKYNSNITTYRAFAIEDITPDCLTTGCLSAIDISLDFPIELATGIFTPQKIERFNYVDGLLSSATYNYSGTTGAFKCYEVNSPGAYYDSIYTEGVYIPVTSLEHKLGIGTSDTCWGIVHTLTGIDAGAGPRYVEYGGDCSTSFALGRSYRVHRVDWASMPLCSRVFMSYTGIDISFSGSSLNQYFDSLSVTQRPPYELNSFLLPEYPHTVNIYITGAA